MSFLLLRNNDGQKTLEVFIKGLNEENPVNQEVYIQQNYLSKAE